MSSRSRASSCPSISAPSPSRAKAPSPSQAKLLHGRGDLRGKRASFNINLETPTPNALLADDACRRIGLDLQRAGTPEQELQRLLVAGVDAHPRRKTPVARWNTQEERQAKRGDGECHASLALLPGDRLRAINDVNGETAMLAELQAAMSFTSPKAVNLAISRDISDVLAPSPMRKGVVVAPVKLPRLPGTPPRMPTAERSDAALRTPPRSMPTSGYVSRSSSAGSIRSGSAGRSRSGSRRGSRAGLGSAAQMIDMSWSHAGQAVVAF